MRAILAVAALTLAAPALAAAPFTLKSSEVKQGGTLTEQQVFNGFGCSGQNVSPELSWQNAPQGTKSFALMVHDPDAPTGSGWWHWVVYDIPANVTELPTGAGSGKAALPEGAKQGKTDFGSPGWGGPCPPPGKPHRYVFTVFALKVDKLDVPADATGAFVGFMARANAIANASLTAKYGRQK
jgi:Raf kinase inhibitor-like YbhB/YbcL family protein